MRKIISVAAIALLALGCGRSSVDSEIVGQPKKIVKQTPIFCENYTDVDISLGFVKDGVGSMSNQDIWLTVPNQSDIDTLNKAVDENKLVKVIYDEYRTNFCWNSHVVKSIYIIDDKREDKKSTKNWSE